MSNKWVLFLVLSLFGLAIPASAAPFEPGTYSVRVKFSDFLGDSDGCFTFHPDGTFETTNILNTPGIYGATNLDTANRLWQAVLGDGIAVVVCHGEVSLDEQRLSGNCIGDTPVGPIFAVFRGHRVAACSTAPSDMAW